MLIGVFEVRVNVHLGVIVTESVQPRTHAHGSHIIMLPVVRFVETAQTAIQSRQVDVTCTTEGHSILQDTNDGVRRHMNKARHGTWKVRQDPLLHNFKDSFVVLDVTCVDADDQANAQPREHALAHVP